MLTNKFAGREVLISSSTTGGMMDGGPISEGFPLDKTIMPCSQEHRSTAESCD